MLHSRKIIRQKKLARKVESSLYNHKDRVVAGLVSFFTPYLVEGETLPDFDILLELQARVISRHRLELQDKDRAHLKEVDNDKILRRVRDGAGGRLFKKMGEIVRTIDGAYIAGRCQELLGFGAGLANEPEQVAEGAEKAIERIDAPGFAFPETDLDGVDLGVEDIRKQLAEPYTDLGTAIAALDAEKDKFDATVTAKQAAARDLNSAYVRHSRLSEELYRISGHDELANRLRPVSHQSKDFRPDGGEPGNDGDNGDAADGADGTGPDPGDGADTETGAAGVGAGTTTEDDA